MVKEDFFRWMFSNLYPSFILLVASYNSGTSINVRVSIPPIERYVPVPLWWVDKPRQYIQVGILNGIPLVPLGLPVNYNVGEHRYTAQE